MKRPNRHERRHLSDYRRAQREELRKLRVKDWLFIAMVAFCLILGLMFLILFPLTFRSTMTH